MKSSYSDRQSSGRACRWRASLRKRAPWNIFICLVAAGSAAGAFAQQSPLDRVTAVMREYGRDITENRFDVKCKVSVFDPAGKFRKIKNRTHRLEFTKGRFKGSGEAESDWHGAFRITHAERSTAALVLYTDLGAFDPIFVFSPSAHKHWEFQSTTSTDGNSVTISYRSTEACKAFELSAKGFQRKDGRCGSGQVTLDESAAIAVRASFEAWGFPISSGKEVMSSYRVEDEFQVVSVAGTKQPFLFPKRAISTFVLNREKTVVECEYTAGAGK